jgi:propanediol dehydratase small subunit
MSHRNNTYHTYPLSEHAAETLRAASGRAFGEISLEAAVSGELTADDLRVHAETLRAQAEIARQHGYPQLAANLARAAELTAVPNETLLEMYNQLRPHRCSFEELQTLAQTLRDEYQAPVTAAFVEEAAAVYRARGLLKRE